VEWTYEAVEAEQDVEQANGKGAEAVLGVFTITHLQEDRRWPR
jgi:hypothetical protein